MNNNDLPINVWAHRLMVYIPIGLNNAERIGKYNIVFHGDRLYSLRRPDSDIVVLVHANNPHEAVSKVRGIYERID